MPDIPHPNNIRWGRIRRRDGETYDITPADVCTLAISTKGEDENAPELIIWCYVQRKMTGVFTSSSWSFRRMVQLHSQPINPSWAWPDNWDEARRRGGSRSAWNKANRYFREGHNNVSQTRLRRRKNNIRKIDQLVAGDQEEWNSVPDNIKAALVMCLTGQVGNMIPGKTDFANLESTAERADAVRLGSGNYFISQPRLPRGQRVEIIAPDGTSSLTRRVSTFPRGSSVQVAFSEQDPAVMAQITAQGVLEGTAIGENITANVAGVATAQAAVHRYSIMPREELERSIDDWATEIEALLTTFEPV